MCSKSDVNVLVPVEVSIETWDGPCGASVAFLLAHGAGGKSNSPQMIRYRELLSNFGTVFQFDYPGQWCYTFLVVITFKIWIYVLS